MRELDDLLVRWLEREWTSASEAQRGVFLRLLDCEDDRLWRWFLGHETAPDAALDSLILRTYQWRQIGPDKGGRSIGVSRRANTC